MKAHGALVDYINSDKEKLHCESFGNFMVFVGDEDQYIHLWRYDDGYSGIDKTQSELRYIKILSYVLYNQKTLQV